MTEMLLFKNAPYKIGKVYFDIGKAKKVHGILCLATDRLKMLCNSGFENLSGRAEGSIDLCLNHILGSCYWKMGHFSCALLEKFLDIVEVGIHWHLDSNVTQR